MKHDLIQFELALTPAIDNANFTDLRFLAMNLRPEDALELSVTRDIADYSGLAWAGAYSRWRKVAIWDRRPVFGFGAAEIPGENSPNVQVWGFGCDPRRPRPQASDEIHKKIYDPGNSLIRRSRGASRLASGQRHVAPLAAILGLQTQGHDHGSWPPETGHAPVHRERR